MDGVGAMDAAVAAAEAVHWRELCVIKAAALVNLAYLQLQQQQWQQTVTYCQELLQVSIVAQDWTVNARLLPIPRNLTGLKTCEGNYLGGNQPLSDMI